MLRSGRTAALVAALLLGLWSPAFAQVPKSTLNTNTSTAFPDNTVGAITPAGLRSYMSTLINSFQQYTGVRAVVLTSDTISLLDYGQLVTYNNGSAIAVTLPQANGSFFPFNVYIRNLGAGTVTITPQGGSTINGAGTLALATGQAAWIISDNTNWQTWFNGQFSVGCGSMPPLTGDVTTPGSSCVTTISANAVSFAKWQQINASSLVGNATGSPANATNIAVGATFQFSGSTLQTVAHTGDVTTSANSFATTIAPNAVTNAKLATMNANTVKANATGGSAVPTDVSPAVARTSALFNIDQATATGDANYGIQATDRMVYHTALTAARTDTLPAANAVNAGQVFVINDFRGVASVSNTITLQRSGSDTINGITSVVAINAQYGAGIFWSDGVSRWTFMPAGAGGGGSGTVTQVICDGVTISTSGTCPIYYFPPQGRITLVSGLPVMTTSQSAATTVYYTPTVGDLVPIYDGSNIVPTQFTEQQIVLGSNWAANSNYDVFDALDTGTSTLRACTGPAWTSDTARGTGAGTTELNLTRGLYLNNVTITCRYNNTTTFSVNASRATYLGTIRTGASTGIVNYIFGGAGIGGVAGNFGIWNAYNRVAVSTSTSDTTAAAWTYAVANTWREANGSTTNRVSFVRGLDQDAVTATYVMMVGAGAGTSVVVGIGLDVTNNFVCCNMFTNTTSPVAVLARFNKTAGLGFHFLAPLEWQNTTTSSNYYSTGGLTAAVQTGFEVDLVQ